jgi:hypothetical protein
LRGKLPPERFTLASRYEQARPVLQRVVSGNYHQPAPLVQILNDLAAQAGVDVLIDRRALAAEGVTDKMEVSYIVEEKPLELTLAELLPPLKLGFRPTGATTLQVTTQKALQACRELEFYSVGKILVGTHSDAFFGEIRREVAPATWHAHGGQGALDWDAPSKTLLVVQSPTVHAALRKFLAEKQAEK